MSVAVCMLFTTVVSYGQGTSIKELPKGWHMMDVEKDGFYGISIDKAYQFLKGKKSTTVIVAVIDSGIDTLHEDLKDILWTNPKEIPGNGIDDDHNGYIDDVHGWNFLGGKDGRNVKNDSDEGSRVYHKYKKIFGGKVVDTATLNREEKEQYHTWLKAKTKIEGDAAEGGGIDVMLMHQMVETIVKGDSVLKKSLGTDIYTGKDLDKFAPVTRDEQKAKGAMIYILKTTNMMESTNKEIISELTEELSSQQKKKEALNTEPENTRAEIVKDDETNFNDRFYGNNDVMANTPLHGTHVSGIIAAKRNNGIGMDGVADNVRIMMIRAVPDGDEHDKDIALAIRYAVDNGARVINMSFGKGFSPQKNWVDSSVQYAAAKGVLLVCAAGNDATNSDTVQSYPNAKNLLTGIRATNWITVGASSDPLAEPMTKSYTASFSNYGKNEVNVFSPGTKIYSTLPGGNTYGNLQGTSMASPVVAGVAALVMSYFPGLSPEQVKYAIEKSATPIALKVKKPGSDELVQLADISTSGGILNAYGAVKLAATLKPASNKQQLPKSALKSMKGL